MNLSGARQATRASIEPAAAAAVNAVPDPLGVLAEARDRAPETLALAARHLDPKFVEVLRIIGFDRTFTHARGSYLYDAAGRAHLDFHTGEGFASLGHNHPDVRAVLAAAMHDDLADGVQIHYSVLAGMLAEALSVRLPRHLDAVFFANSGAEAVDSAMKFARAATRRPRLISCESGFHGLTLGPLSLVGDDFFHEGFGPRVPGCVQLPFGDLDRLEAELRREDVAAFVVEPIQGRAVTTPPPGYLKEAEQLCRRHGTLFVLDEIQTGLGRTGRWFALEHEAPEVPEAPAHDGLEPDFVLIGKALSGGYMPVAAMATRRELHDRAIGTLERSYVHQSTFGRNRLSMAAGLATLRVIERDGLIEHADRIGELLRTGLRELQARHELIAEVRGRGLMLGIELGPPTSRVGRLNWRLLHLATEGLFPQLVVIPLHRDHGIVTMASGKNDVIKLLPPLTLGEAEARTFLAALDQVLTDCEGGRHWGTVGQIATATLRRRTARDVPEISRRPDAVPRPAQPGRRDGDICLITGATGFIGGHLAARLVAEGVQVRCLVRPTSDTSRLAALDVELAFGDLTEPESVAGAVAGADQIVHCGAMVSDWGTVEEIARVNVAGTRTVIEAAAAAGVRRLVHVSSTDVYGHPGVPRLDESCEPTGFANWYAETKRRAEREVLGARAAQGLETTVLRPATVYGPDSIEVVGEIARSIRARRMLLIDGGRAVAGLVYVENVVDAMLLALRADAEAVAGEAFNLTDGLPVTWRQFTDDLAAGLDCPPVRRSLPYPVAGGLARSLEHGYRLLRRATGLHTPPLLSRQAVQVLGRDQDFSAAKARDRLGWQPRVGYEEGLAATLDWLRATERAR